MSKGGPHIGIYLPASTRLNGMMNFQCKFVFLSQWRTFLIIFDKIISFNECNFRLTNIEVARTIASAFKWLMKIPFFQWSKVSKYLQWKSQVDAWFSRFKVNINLNIFNFNLDHLLKLLKIFFYKFLLQGKIWMEKS
jgi:hypothetical protein